MHLAAGAVVLLAAIALYAVGGFGGGDGKLLAAAALWIGFEGLVTYLAFVSIAGGVLAVAILIYRRVPAVEALPIPDWALKLHKQGTGIPYGIAIAAGASARLSAHWLVCGTLRLNNPGLVHQLTPH